MINNINGNKREVKFDTLNDMYEFASEHPMPNGCAYNTGTESGVSSMDEAFELAFFGDKKLTDKIKKTTVEINTLIVEEKQEEYQLSNEGRMFDVATVLSGEPECWLLPEDEEPHRVVDVVFNPSCSHYVSKNYIINRGSSLLSLVKELQEQEYIVNLHLVDSSTMSRAETKSGKLEYLTIKVGIDCRPVDISAVAFAVAHPAFLRRMIFAIKDYLYEKPHDKTAMGSVTQFNRSEFENTIIFNGLTSRNEDKFKSVEISKKTVLDLVEEYNKNGVAII